MDVCETWHKHGFRFRFPGFWEVSERADQLEATVTVSGPETSFWSLALFFDRPQPADLIESAVAAFQQEYEDIDVYPAEAQLCGVETSACDVQFVCLDLINSAFLRAFRTDRATAFVMYQGTDRELESTGPILEAISAGLQCDDFDAGEA
ncbi:MAG: hypothetical protein KY476_22790 [Planctomycetes bacterium]|nr:hypothetical protein [Planctomycetota bacterium]